MARTLTAGQAVPVPETRSERSRPQWDVIAILFSCIGEMWLRAASIRELQPRRDRLDRNLSRPELRDHPLYAEKYRIWQALDATITGHERRAVGLRAQFAHHFAKLSAANRAALLAHDGWPYVQEPTVLAEALWAQAMQGGPWPGGEAGFLGHMADLRRLVAGWIAQEEREAMTWAAQMTAWDRQVAA